MSDVVFPGLGRSQGGWNAYLSGFHGLVGRPSGDDLILRVADVERAFGGRRFLRLHGQIPLVPEHDAETAASLHGLISEEMKQLQMKPPKSITVQPGYGILSDVSGATDLLAVQADRDVVANLRDKIIPIMRDKIGARYVTGVTIDAEEFQKFVSFAKIALLAGTYSDVLEAERHTREGEALAGAVPHALEPLSYLDALTKFSPLALTLPVRRLNCAWHFQSEKMWVFGHAPANGVLAEFGLSINPMAAESTVLGLSGLSNMNESNVWRYLRLVTESLNQLLAYLINPLNFADAGGRVDFLRQVQAMSAVRLIFADLAAMNFSTSAHQRVSFAMSALDKLANLRVQLGGAGGAEGEAFRALCSEAQRDELIRVYRARFGAFGYDELAASFSSAILRSYNHLHAYLGEQDPTKTKSEKVRLDRLWMQRNVRHGMFLQRQQFEKLFLESHGRIPRTLGSLPFLLQLSLLFNSKEFLSFRPAIGP